MLENHYKLESRGPVSRYHAFAVPEALQADRHHYVFS